MVCLGGAIVPFVNKELLNMQAYVESAERRVEVQGVHQGYR